MAPVISKIVTFKNGKKVPISGASYKVVVNLTKKLTTKRWPQRFVPEPGKKRVENESSDEENDQELQELVRQAEARRSRLPAAPEPEPEVEPEVEPEGEPEVEPEVEPLRRANGPPDQNLGSIFSDGDVIEPSLKLSDIPTEHRSEIILYQGSDSSKLKQYYWQYYPDYARYYEMFDCWNEACIKSKNLPLVHTLCVCVDLRIPS